LSCTKLSNNNKCITENVLITHGTNSPSENKRTLIVYTNKNATNLNAMWELSPKATLICCYLWPRFRKKCQYENPVSSASGPGAGADIEFEDECLDECLAATRATKKSVERRETMKDLMENDWDAMAMKNFEKKRRKKETLEIVWGFVFIYWRKSEEMVMLFILVCKRMWPQGSVWLVCPKKPKLLLLLCFSNFSFQQLLLFTSNYVFSIF